MPNPEQDNTIDHQSASELSSSQAKILTQLNDFIISCNNIEELEQAEKELIEKITAYEFSWDENMIVMSDLLNRLHDKIQHRKIEDFRSFLENRPTGMEFRLKVTNNNNNNNNNNNINDDLVEDYQVFLQEEQDNEEVNKIFSDIYKDVILPTLVESYDESLQKVIRHDKTSKQGLKELREFKSTFPEINNYLYGECGYQKDRPNVILRQDNERVISRFIKFIQTYPAAKEFRETINIDSNKVMTLLTQQDTDTQSKALYFASRYVKDYKTFEYFLSFFEDTAILKSAQELITAKNKINHHNTKSRNAPAPRSQHRKHKEARENAIGVRIEQIEQSSLSPHSTVLGKKRKCDIKEKLPGAPKIKKTKRSNSNGFFTPKIQASLNTAETANKLNTAETANNDNTKASLPFIIN